MGGLRILNANRHLITYIGGVLTHTVNVWMADKDVMLPELTDLNCQ